MERGQLVVLFLMITAATLCAVRAEQEAHAACSSYPAVFLFGDSLEDTGNGPHIGVLVTTMLPYGITFPGYADLRFSDGRVTADFLATYLGLPPLNPSLMTTCDFSQGVNYATPGATALPLMPYSFETQIRWHLALREEVIARGDQPRRPSQAAFEEGLYVIQLGGNDFFHYYWRQYSPQYVNTTILPLVIQETRAGLERLYSNGARNFLVFGVVPAGCTPATLANFSGDGDAVDSHGCLLEYNEVAEYHAVQILTELQSFRELHPDATIAFADYFAAYMHVLDHPESYGFTHTLDACCGAGPHSHYGFNISIYCNNHTESLYVCNDPNTYIYWDGLHYTDRFNFQIFNQTIRSRSYLYPYDGLATCASNRIDSEYPLTSNNISPYFRQT